MIKPTKLGAGDKIAIISLSRGLVGEPFMAFQRELIIRRLNEFGLETVYTPNALKGIEFLSNNPQKRAEDLKWAFENDDIKGIICAIGGDDTYKTIPYLLEDKSFINNVQKHPKIFIGYSDSTINHLMFYKLGLITYYGHSAIVDFGELGKEMLPYSKMWFEHLFKKEESIEITSSPIWYCERTTFDESEWGKDRISQQEEKGYEVLQGVGSIKGEFFGGCVECLSELISGGRYGDEAIVNSQFCLFPAVEELKGKILFLETSEEKPSPKRLKELLLVLEQYGVFKAVGGVLVGKPMDESYYAEYREIYKDIAVKYNKPVLFNMNFGHSHPKCILPYGVEVTIDCERRTVTINEPMVR